MKDKNVIIIGGGNTAMDAARTSKRLGANITIVYRRTKKEMPARVEELAHALEEGISSSVLRGPTEFISGGDHKVCHAMLDIMELGPPDASGRRSPVPTGKTETIPVDLVIMALGNDSNPIIKDSEPRIKTSKWGTLARRERRRDHVEGRLFGRRRHPRRLDGHQCGRRRQSGGDQIAAENPVHRGRDQNSGRSAAEEYTRRRRPHTPSSRRRDIATGIVEITVKAPMVAKSAKAGQFVRVLPTPKAS